MTSQRRTTRSKKEASNVKEIKGKFLDERLEFINSRPLIALNSKQQDYIDLVYKKDVVVATGYAGTSKTYIPVCMAADAYSLGELSKIYITRPALSSSRSVGYTSGDFSTKMKMWLGAVMPILHERLGKARTDIAIDSGDIEFIPLEVIKGMSLNNAWLIVEEASDLTKEEIVKLVTRVGKNSKLILSGDIRQAELKGDLGLSWLSQLVLKNKNLLDSNFGFIDFDQIEHIVRSDTVRNFIKCVTKNEVSVK